MLPDYPKTKKLLFEFLMNYQNERIKYYAQPLLDNKPMNYQEGNSSRLIRENGLIEEKSIDKIEAETSFSFQEIDRMNFDEILLKFDEIAQGIASKLFTMGINEIDRVTTNVGNKFNFSGEELRPEHLFEMLKKIHVDFDNKDNPILPTCLSGEKTQKKIIDLFNEIDENPQYRNKFNEIIIDKRIEWREREASRKLVE